MTTVNPIVLKEDELFTLQDLGLCDGKEWRGEAWDKLSRNKGPGLDNMLDVKLLGDEDYKEEVAYYIKDIMNGKIELPNELQEGKIMYLSKKKSERVQSAADVRMIVISNTVKKLLEICWL